MEKDLIEYIVKSLVDEPDSVDIQVVEQDGSTVLELRVSEGDIGKVIGKHGRIAKAMRTVLQASSSKNGNRTVLEILD
ncbi:MAG: KH domain-containing protein [Termitinemataceae bacterium]|nr:MAG: KH domain-containing protein [Termitinemataceae bacterium]